MSKIPEPLVVVALEDVADPTNSMSSSSSDGVLLWTGFSVSKHNIPSKQSSNPSLLRAFRAWTLSALVKICYTGKKKKGKHLENATQLAIFDGYINAYEL